MVGGKNCPEGDDGAPSRGELLLPPRQEILRTEERENVSICWSSRGQPGVALDDAARLMNGTHL